MARRLVAVWGWILNGNVTIQYRDEDTIGPLVPNLAQWRVFRGMLKQAKLGLPIRVAVPKARREGISTVVQAINVGMARLFPCWHARMIAHTDADSLDIFAIATRLNDHLPEAEAGEASGRAITWGHDSSYTCRTGGGRGPGRGGTLVSLHFTEMSYLQTVAGLDKQAVAGLMNIIVDEPHTMIIAEGTGAGPDGEFHRVCMDAAVGKGDFELVFVPWFEDAAYRRVPPAGWEPSEDEIEMQGRYNLDLHQVYWYHAKSLAQPTKADMLREFPSCLSDCFATMEGRVYPLFMAEQRYCRTLDVADVIANADPEDDSKIGLMRAIDWGWAGDHAFVCLWLAYDNTQMPQLVINPADAGCQELIKEMMLYAWHPTTGEPLKKHDHGPDCLRYAAVTAKLGGLVYVYRAVYLFDTYGTGGPETAARTVHRLSGWSVPTKADERDLTQYRAGEDGESYAMTVADRSGRGYIELFNGWGIECREHGKPTKRSVGRGEVKDGIGEVATLISGTAWREAPPPPDPHEQLIRSAIAKTEGKTPFGRQASLTEEEQEAMDDDYAGVESGRHFDHGFTGPRL